MKLFLASDLRNLYPLFHDWVGDLQWKRVAWIQNGCDVYEDPYWINETKEFFLENGSVLVAVDLRETQWNELEQLVRSCDGIYVTWWNIFYLLDLVRRSRLDTVLENLKSTDMRYAGSSAWAALLGKSIAHCDILDDITKWPNLESTDALWRLDYCLLPHRGKEKYRKYFEKIFELKDLPAPLLLMEDHHYITI